LFGGEESEREADAAEEVGRRRCNAGAGRRALVCRGRMPGAGLQGAGPDAEEQRGVGWTGCREAARCGEERRVRDAVYDASDAYLCQSITH
jgi:hypothetical protein